MVAVGCAAMLAQMFMFNPVAGAQDLLYNGYANETLTFDPSASATVDFGYFHDGWEGTRRAAQFQAPADAHHVVEGIGMPIHHNGTLNLRMSIVEDAGDAPGATVLWSVENPPEVTAVLAHRVIPAQALLQPGAKYWLVLEPVNPVASYAYWKVSVPSFPGREAISSYSSGQWSAWNSMDTPNRAAFQIYGRTLAPSVLLYNGYNNTTTNHDSSNGVGIYYETQPQLSARRHAAVFTAPEGAHHVVESIGLPIRHNGELNLRISLVEDAGGAPGSTVLWSVENPPQILPDAGHRTIPASAVLQPGSNYWLVLEPASLEPVFTTWLVSQPPFVGQEALSDYFQGQWWAWSVDTSLDRPAFQIHGRPLPEPADLELHTAVEIRFETVLGSVYLVEAAEAPGSQSWLPLGGPFMGAGGPTSVFHSIRGTPRGTYRVWTE
jgi:hypothetical protein